MQLTLTGWLALSTDPLCPLTCSLSTLS